MTTSIFIFNFQMDSEIKRVSDIFDKMPKFDWQKAHHVEVSFFSLFFSVKLIFIRVLDSQNYCLSVSVIIKYFAVFVNIPYIAF